MTICHGYVDKTMRPYEIRDIRNCPGNSFARAAAMT